MIIAFVFYTVLQLGYAQKKENLLFAIILAVLTVAAIYWMYWIYKRELKQENDWVFNAKPHWDVRRVIIITAKLPKKRKKVFIRTLPLIELPTSFLYNYLSKRHKDI